MPTEKDQIHFEAAKRILASVDDSGPKLSLLLPYGSRVYGTHSDTSDYDYYAVVSAPHSDQQVLNIKGDVVNLTIVGDQHFKDLLVAHSATAVEAWLHSGGAFSVNKETLRRSFSEKSSNSWVKCKKKLIDADTQKTVGDPAWLDTYYIGMKSMFHSMRILNFGISLATTGAIDFSKANEVWEAIKAKEGFWTWEEVQVQFKPEYNALSTKFREVAPTPIKPQHTQKR